MLNSKHKEADNFFHKNINIDILFFIFLSLIGWLSILSIEYKSDMSFFNSLLNRQTNFSKQFIWIIISFSLGIIIINTSSKIFATIGYFAYFFGIGLMIITIFSGSNFRGSKSWLYIAGFPIQIVQIMFIVTPLALSKYIANCELSYKKFKDKLMPLLIIFFPLILTIYQSETGLALVFLSLLIILYIEGYSSILLLLPFYLIILLVCSIAFNSLYFIIALSILLIVIILIFKNIIFRQKILLLLLFVFYFFTWFLQSKAIPYSMHKILAPYQVQRLEHTFKLSFNKEENLVIKNKKADNYNVKQSIVAIGSGGFYGKGFLNNTQTRLDFVPEQATDFIICSFAESFGFLGVFILLIIYILILLRILSFAEKQRSVFSRCYCYCFVAIIFFHIVVNLGMTIGVLPVIGIPLPFISYGGSSFVTFSIMYFIVVRLDMDRQIVIK